MQRILTKSYIALIIAVVLCCSCNKEWLDTKRDQSLIVPTTLKDFDLLLTAEDTFFDQLSLAEFSSDDYTLTTERWNVIGFLQQNAYLWKEDIYQSSTGIADWDKAYKSVLTANVVIEGLEKIARVSNNALEWDRLKGSALLLRGRNFFNLVRLFGPQYIATKSQESKGIILKINSDVNQIPNRSNLEECYQKILGDLSEASVLLPNNVSHKTLPSKASAYALLARCYLTMKDFPNANKYADLSLAIHSELIDYNTLDQNAIRPFALYNKEVLQHNQIDVLWSTFSYASRNYVNPDLYNMYHSDDLRKRLFFRDFLDGNFSFKGSYTASNAIFTGPTTSEMFLIRAECNARMGKIQEAQADLNILLVKRYKTGKFVSITVSDQKELLKIVLNERRKELLRRGLRWFDLKRLNTEAELSVTLKRTIDGIEHILSPNSERYILPIPSYIKNQ